MEETHLTTELIERARAAQRQIEDYTQEQVLTLARAMALTAIQNAEPWANMCYEETGMGNVESKIAKIRNAPRGLMRDLLSAKTVGVVERDEEKKLFKIAKPVGVIAALLPVTIPETSPVFKSMCAVMGRNAIIFSPNPKSARTSGAVVDALRQTLARFGAPMDLLQCVANPTKALSAELMARCNLVVATGGGPMVKAAYSSGTPAYGVGAGNVVSTIDETARLQDAAHKIMESQLNDLALGCSSENALLIQEGVYDEMMAALKAEGGVLLGAADKQKLQNTLWIDGHLNGELICKPAHFIAERAGISLPPGGKFILVEEDGYGKDHPFSGEKLCVVLAVYKYKTMEDAIRLTNNIQAYQGAGHSCGIHSHNQDHILAYALGTKTSRVMINSPQNKANAGSFQNGMPFTNTLSCGTWGGNITNENITWKHFINTTWVAEWKDEAEIPTDEELFGDVLAKMKA